MNLAIMFLILNLFFSPFASTQRQEQTCVSPEKSGWELEGLKGNVKILRTEEIHLNYIKPKRELVKQITFDSEGNYVETIEPMMLTKVYKHTEPKPIYTFDANCRPIERKGLYGEWGMTKTTYLYNGSGKLKERAIYDSEGRLLWKAVYNFDNKGNLTEEIETIQVHPEHFRPPRYDVYRITRSTFKYDEKGNMIENVDYKYDGSLYATYFREYDAKGRVIKLTRTDGKGRLQDQSLYKYADGDILLEEDKYTSFEYYANDEMIPGKIYSGFGMFQHGSKIVYEYDKRGNWTKETQYDVRQDKGETSYELDMITYRAITYF